MPCRAGHVLNYDGFCRLCGAWLVDVDGPLSPFHKQDDEQGNEHEHRGNDASDDD